MSKQAFSFSTSLGYSGGRDFQDVITALASYGCHDGACRRFVLDAWDRNGVCDTGTGEGTGKVEFTVEVDGCCCGTRRPPVRKNANVANRVATDGKKQREFIV